MKYGIWGFGVVGKSVLQFLSRKGYELSVMDRRAPTAEERLFLAANNITYFSQDDQEQFFAMQNYIVPSPGIDLAPLKPYKEKLVSELDLFSAAWHKPLIAVTGSLGKTSTVSMLEALLKKNGLHMATGGNIGLGMLDLVEQQDEIDYGLLELSSFQLEYAQSFAPDLAIITNIYANHLDRHGTLENYVSAKMYILAHQKDHQDALLPLSLAPTIKKITDRPMSYFSMKATQNELENLRSIDTFYELRENHIYKTQSGVTSSIIDLPTDLPGFKENWLVIIATCDILSLGDQQNKVRLEDTNIIPPHRLELVPSAMPYSFYNDSKSTVLEATFTAVERLQPARIHLFLGGISKGVDRAANIAQLKNKIVTAICFGSEASQLQKACEVAGILATAHTHLDNAFAHCMSTAQPHDTILFSPAGASYDLYKIYTERGDHFKRLVAELSSL